MRNAMHADIYIEGELYDNSRRSSRLSTQTLVSAFWLELSSCYDNETTFVVNRKAYSMSSGKAARLLEYVKQTSREKEYEWQPSKASGCESAKIDQST